jgi:hypothetical protein
MLGNIGPMEVVLLGLFAIIFLAVPVAVILWIISRRGKGASPVRACPHCAENIKVAARTCRFCGRDVAPESRGPRSLYDSGDRR